MATCKTCGKKCDGEYCFQHKPRKQLMSNGKPMRKVKLSGASKELYDEMIADRIQAMQQFFLQIWKKRQHLSEISGLPLVGEPLSVYFHHILPKNKYPEAALDEENIILLTLNEHDQVESDIYRYEEINKRREQLKLKYEGAK